MFHASLPAFGNAMKQNCPPRRWLGAFWAITQRIWLQIAGLGAMFCDPLTRSSYAPETQFHIFDTGTRFRSSPSAYPAAMEYRRRLMRFALLFCCLK
jgi:hypothetical protein